MNFKIPFIFIGVCFSTQGFTQARTCPGEIFLSFQPAITEKESREFVTELNQKRELKSYQLIAHLEYKKEKGQLRISIRDVNQSCKKELNFCRDFRKMYTSPCRPKYDYSRFRFSRGTRNSNPNQTEPMSGIVFQPEDESGETDEQENAFQSSIATH